VAADFSLHLGALQSFILMHLRAPGVHGRLVMETIRPKLEPTSYWGSVR